MNGNSTIYAVSSGSGRAGIAVVRLSGLQVQAVLSVLAGPLPQPRQAAFRSIRSRDGQELLDRGLVLFFPGPRSVTGEDVGELHVHGSPALVERVLVELSGFEGLRLAEPGEFTKRAFAHERMDLLEVEGLSDLLQAESEPQRKLAMRQFSGEASSVYHVWHHDLVGALAIIEAAIDFADEDGVAAQAIALARPRLQALCAKLGAALQQSEQASMVRRGLRIVIAGAPNVGKSSLLNALAGRDVAIVSPTAGTTRDVVEAPVMMAGLPVSVSDTAGLRGHTQDEIEAEGMARSRREISGADILVWVEAADIISTELPEREPDIVVFNKVDKIEPDLIHVRNDRAIRLSVKTGAGIEDFRRQLSALVQARTNVGESAVMVRLRHRVAVEESIRLLNDSLLQTDDALELMAEDVRKAAAALASVTGRVDAEEFLGRIFQEFCIGK